MYKVAKSTFYSTSQKETWPLLSIPPVILLFDSDRLTPKSDIHCWGVKEAETFSTLKTSL